MRTELSRALRRCFALPPVMWLILAGFVGLAGWVSVANPLFESTDEIRHYRYARALVMEQRLPIQGQEDVRTQSHHPPLYYALTALATGWLPSDHTATFEQPINPYWGYRNWAVGVDNKLQYWHGPAGRFPFAEGYLAAVAARWVNIGFGALTVLLTYHLGRMLWPERDALAWGAAALVAGNPQFIYLSAALNNDILAAAMGTAVLWGSLKLLRDGLRRRDLLLLGALYGLALLTKLHLAVLGAVIVGALAHARGFPRKGWTRRLGELALVLGVAALLSGWWFARNLRLYGDLTGMRALNALWGGRPAAGNWWAIQQGLPYLWSSLWGRFGYGQIPLPAAFYGLTLAFSGVGMAGLLLPRRPKPAVAAWLWLALTVLLTLGIVLYYMLIQPAGAMGRFLFPAFPAFAVLALAGWDAWLNRPRALGVGVAAGGCALALVALGGYLWPAVRYPPRAREPEMPLHVRFGDVARLVAVEVAPETIAPGEPVFVTVTWEPTRGTARPYAVYVHLVDEAGAVIAQRDTWPGLGRAPTTSWRSGRLLMDTYRVDVPGTVYAPNRATVRLGLYEPEWGRLPIANAGPFEAADGSLTVGAVDVIAADGPWPNAMRANFGDEIALVGYTLEPRVLRPGETMTLTLYWEPLRPLAYNYAVFAQVLGAEFRVWGSRDGAGPGWAVGEIITDTRPITLVPETPPGSYPVQVGLFSEAGRLPVVAADGRHLDERVLLGPIRVEE